MDAFVPLLKTKRKPEKDLPSLGKTMMDFVIKKKRKKHSTTKKLTTNAEFIKMLRVSRSTGFAEQVATKTQRQRIQHVTSTVDTNMLNYFNQQQVAKLNKEGGILYLFLGEQAPLHENKITHWLHDLTTDADYVGSILPAAAKALGYSGNGLKHDKSNAVEHLIRNRGMIIDCLPLSLNYTSALRASVTYANLMSQVSLRIRTFLDKIGLLVSPKVRVIWAYKKCGIVGSQIFRRSCLQLKTLNKKELVLNTDLDISSLGATKAGYPHHSVMKKALAMQRENGVVID